MLFSNTVPLQVACDPSTACSPSAGSTVTTRPLAAAAEAFETLIPSI
ncbi:hypothetical protein J2129_000831 [Methanofollis sp. W23]|nr:hypothetical protein [Methanofollis sp. W23]